MSVLAVSLDSTDHRLVSDWIAAGELPVLAALLERGSRAGLDSPGDLMPESVWPTLATGCNPGSHGHYNFRCIMPGTYEQVHAPGRSYRRSFWELLAERGRRVLLFDVPYADILGDDRVTQVLGWGQRGAIFRGSWPQGLIEELNARHGAHANWLDEGYDRSLRAERRFLDTALAMTERRTEAMLDLLDRTEWDVAVLDLWEVHNACHIFHRFTEPSHHAYDARRARVLGDALLKTYRAADDSLGALIEAAGPDADVIAFSSQGLRENTNGIELLPRLLERLGYQVPKPTTPTARFAHLARSTLPISIRRHVNRRLPIEVRMRLMARMWSDGIDWPRTRAVAESEHGHGWIRINLRGREPGGIVEPGAEYRVLWDELAADLRALRNDETGEPAVAEIMHPTDILEGDRTGELPDMLIRWSDDSYLWAARHPRIGVIREDRGDQIATEHTGAGYAIAAGPQIARGAEIQGELMDLAPTILHLSGCPIPEQMEGEPLTGLFAPGTDAAAAPRREPIDWSDERWAPRELDAMTPSRVELAAAA